MPKIPNLFWLCALLAGPVTAQETQPYVLDTIDVVDDVPEALAWDETSIAGDQLETRFQGSTLQTILRSAPGVTVRGGAAGGAETAVNIRGLQDYGRVAVTVDGMRQNFARSGHGANGSFAVDTEMLREISVSRGPGAKVGAVGGALEMRTVEAADVLPVEGGAVGGEFRLRYGTLSEKPTLHGAVAAQLSDAVDLTVAATRAEVGDYTSPDGTNVYAWQETRSRLATVGFTNENGGQLTFSASRLDMDYYTGRTSGLPRDNNLRTDSYSFGYRADDVLGGWAVNAKLYDVSTQVSQRLLTEELVQTGVDRSYHTGTTGILIEGARLFAIGTTDHDVGVAFEGFRDTVTTDDPANASLTPSGNRELWSLSIEDRIALGGAIVTLGLSADRYKLGSSDATVTGQALSPRIALEIPVGSAVTLYGGMALASRFPSLNETLVNGLHPEPADFAIRPNPDLLPERMRSFEIGIGYARQDLFTSGDFLELHATGFHNKIEDYIGLVRVGGLFNGYYQYDNIDNVRIRGLELEASYQTGVFFGDLAGQVLDGIDLATGDELTSVPPDRLVLTAGYRSLDGRRELGARLTSVGTKEGGTLPSPAWQTVDLFYQQALSDRTTLGVTLNNILNKNYTPHLETQPSPGFNAQASLIVRF
ncbi:TonB-dependent receptor domain-containing protein [Sedimentitalea todarodis]|uniref:TonB-dependent receptor n=1 Tax=Sedimentitalea todarodis TaxID=1631240 RepID=A0ABU3V9W4_9RHOB|nr:TonB-dependent receptor [Sedimentitalea todarodis]MDU9002942.1 TonB-dependent receptor [Sedimentitalea todarodis]